MTATKKRRTDSQTGTQHVVVPKPTPKPPTLDERVEVLTAGVRHVQAFVTGIADAVARIDGRVKAPKADTYAASKPVHEWQIAPEQDSYVSYSYGEKRSETLAEPATVLVELRQRVETLNKLDMMAVVTINVAKGTLELHAREKLT